MTSVVDLVQVVVRRELGGIRHAALGVVAAVHPHSAGDDDANDEVDVRLKHEDLELVRVPVAVAQPGTAAPLKAGDLVLVQFLEGDLQQALVTATFHHADERPPLHEAGELVLEHRVAKDGTRNQLRFSADGDIHIDRELGDKDPTASVHLSHTGDVTVTTGTKVKLVLANDGTVTLECDTLTVKADVVIENGDLTVKQGSATFSKGGETTVVEGTQITGRMGGA